ncbi:MAG: beta-ketoacyl synthase N-terminal-like domain-containing protein [Acidobacteriota bacterium]
MTDVHAAPARRVMITGSGLVSALGHAPASVHAALCAGRSALAPIERFAVDGLSVRRAGLVRDFDARAEFGKRNPRPLDQTGRLVVAAVGRALVDAGWRTAETANAPIADPRASDGPALGLVLGTTFGSVHTISAFDRRAQSAGPSYAKPLDFANSVINAAAGQTAIWHGLAGVNSTVTGGPSAGLRAIGYAAGLIRSGRADVVIAGGADELCFESFYGYHASGALAGAGLNGAGLNGDGSRGHGASAQDDGGDVGVNGSGDAAARPVPFDASRNGFALGEGAAVVVLEAAEVAAARGATLRAEVLGEGNAFDISRGADAATATAAIASAMRQALAEAGRHDAAAVRGAQTIAIDAISSAARGATDGDRHEADALAQVFGERCPPVTALKAMLGECLGASGALQAVDLIESMRSGGLPGVRDLDVCDPALPSAVTQALAPMRRLLRGGLQRGLINAIGFDGNACAVVLGAPGRSAAS